jgi:bisphosphoglycerate-dependent phosphoglycerate mutase
MIIENLTPEEILKTEIATGVPITYELDTNLGVVSKSVLTSPTE